MRLAFMKNHFPVALWLTVLCILTGCDRCSKAKDASNMDEKNAAASAAGEKTSVQHPIATSEGRSGGEPVADATTLQITDVKTGDGEEAVDGKKVTVEYSGSLTNGTRFD